MNLILNNPYRILGLLVGATPREQTRQVSRLRQYIEAEQKPENDYSFDGLGNLNRTIAVVDVAASQLNLNDDKMSAALFWFYNGNKITDEPAFDALKDYELDTCIAIWEKLIVNGDVTARNASAFNNLGTIYLSGVLNATNTNEANLQKGLSLKLQFLESDFANIFKALATDETYKANQKELQLLFLKQLQAEIELSKLVSIAKFLTIVNKLTFSAKADYLKGFIQTPIENIERQITEAERKSKANKAKAGDYGNELYNATKADFALVKSILPNSDIKLINIADKLAEALLECSIDVFNHFHETETEVGEIALDLNNKAKIIARSNRVIARIDESSPVVQEYIKGADDRRKSKLVESDLDGLVEILDLFSKKNETIDNARLLINQTKASLANMKKILGTTDKLYLQLSTQVAILAQHNIIEEVNSVQENLDRTLIIDKYGTLNKLKSTLKNAWSVIVLMDSLDLEYDFKTKKYNSNKDTLKALCEQLGLSTSRFNPSAPSSRTTPYITTTSSSNSNTSDEFDFTDNAWWILGIAGVIIGLIADLAAGCIITGIIGMGIGVRLKK